jgi:hypothetical protein
MDISARAFSLADSGLQTVSGARLLIAPIAIAGNTDPDPLETVITMLWNG